MTAAAARQAPRLTPLAAQARGLARALKAKANECDDAFVKHADPRALQGGAICEEADAWRKLSRTAYRLCGDISDQEE